MQTLEPILAIHAVFQGRPAQHFQLIVRRAAKVHTAVRPGVWRETWNAAPTFQSPLFGSVST
ncbi:MAG: hypothetical protein AB7G75_09360 [Candidatus Binatia bacterium]